MAAGGGRTDQLRVLGVPGHRGHAHGGVLHHLDAGAALLEPRHIRPGGILLEQADQRRKAAFHQAAGRKEGA
ncbi:hypothetical protein SDC9_203485 [bioreactor metagenome]|uniref:Uncharacterized protein n=1 Tax=bioreactor metagenome TaxID=1076179 RepID=A0A645IWU2_9ZZZZ